MGLCVPSGDADASDERDANAREASVERVEARLVVYRGGQTRPGGQLVDPAGGYVEAVAEYELVAPAEPGDVLVLLDFTRALADEPKHLDEIAMAGYLPGPFDPARLEVTGAWGASSVERADDDRALRLRLRPGTRRVTLRYGVDVPHRFWPFGCARDRCSLSGALAPLPSVPARGAADLPPGRVVQPAVWDVEARFAFADDAEASRPHELVVVDTTGIAAYPSVFWGPRWRRAQRYFHGVRIEVLHEDPRPQAQHPRESKIALRRDIPGRVIGIAQGWIRVLEAAGQPPEVDSQITVVEGPLRTAVAQFHPDVVVVSDLAYDLFPGRHLPRFHQEAIARAGLDMLADRIFRGRHAPSVDLWLSGAVGFGFLQLWRQLRDSPDTDAADILRNLTFVPAVDRFLYSQQASFAQTYFRGVEDQMPLRNHPLFFGHVLPTGRRIHEKLSDTLGSDRLEAFYRDVLRHPDADPERAAERAYGYTLDWFFEQWLGPYPSVDYRVAEVRSRRHGDLWRHEIEIERVGERPVIEPVQILVVEKGGNPHYLVWNGASNPDARTLADEPAVARHVFELETQRPLANVRLDPRGRLLQEPQEDEPHIDPMFNDRTPPSFRFLYTGAQLSVAVAEIARAASVAAGLNAITGFIAFEGSLRRDLRRTGQLLLSRDRETHLGVGVGMNLGFLEKVNPQRRRLRLRLGLNTAWLNAHSLDPRGGLRVTQSVALVDDTRRFGWWPEFGRSLSIGLAARQTLRTDEGPADHRYDLVATLEWDHLWRLAKGHVFATQLRGEAVFPIASRPEFRSLSRVGGIGGLSGYGGDEVFGLASVLGQVEYRHLWLADLNLNVLNLVYLRGLGGVAFAGAATVSGCESYGKLFGRGSWYGHVGYGITAHTYILGVNPQLLRVDVSVPIVRRREICLGEVLPDYLAEVQGADNPWTLLPPLSVNVTFAQPF